MKARSVIDIPEPELLRVLYDDPMFRSKILPHDCGSHWPHFEVPLPELFPGAVPPHGDVDLLVIPVESAPDAIAIQFKRVKVGAGALASGMANKVRELRKLARQTNLLVDLGFHRVNASILILVDARQFGAPDPWLSQTPVEVTKQVDRVISESGFHPLACVEILEICQPFDVDFRLRGSTSRRLFQNGSSQPQPDELSERLLANLVDAA